MELTIVNHGDGVKAGVTSEHQLRVESEVHELQHHVSRSTGQAYQVRGETDTLTAATIPVLHIRNDDPERKLVVSFIRFGLAGSNATLPGVGDYFTLGYDTTISGGAEVAAVNMNRTSGADALITATASTPTSAGTMLVFDKWFPDADGADEHYNKQGSLILGLNDTLQVGHTSTSTTGIAWARVTFMMMDFNGD